MKRRRFIQALAATPAAPALLAQAPPAPSVAKTIPNSGTDAPLLYAAPDAAAEPVPHFFTAQQFAALRKLSDILNPPVNGAPGALEAKAPEFLDFLLSQSSVDRQQLYRLGLDGLNAQARKRFTKPFADVDARQAEVLLAPLHEPWTYDAPAEPVAAMLRAAKDDIRRATTNSREWNLAATAGRARGGGGGLYWLPID
ncbi:MAG: gluconate 2-dehydrogenase subunit 3 family protein [Bryobacteraceae bacterium]